MNDLGNRRIEYLSAGDAVAVVKPGDRVFFQGAAMTPTLLIDALCDRYESLENIEIFQIHTDGEARYTQAPYSEAFHLSSLFVGSNVRQAVNGLSGDYIPIFLGEIHRLFKGDDFQLDVAFIQVSPPDIHGYCSLGVSVDITLPAIEKAKHVIALVNPQVPRTHGDGMIHRSKIDVAVEVDQPIFTYPMGQPSASEIAIGKHVAGLVEDGATLQMGIGNIPNVVLSNLMGHRRLGVHTEMFSDGILPLVRAGIITGEEKRIKPNKIVTAFAAGSQALYDFVHENPSVDFKAASFTNDPSLIRLNPKVTSINSAIEIDLTGQICADSIGTYQFSGVGGQIDFMRGAVLSPGGKPIIAITSTTRKGLSKIVPTLRPGAGVTTTRAHVHYVVTEFGVVNLFGKSLKERARALIQLAHPDHREALDREAHERFNGGWRS
ncbi:acetyl-CoA hydrolase/transferase family protein [Lewinella sp. W8]|uniref:acetyl-CoA hydrolase/transferase family protein n=1 Tax=Lewinella sp. W8 TaxID=2528208 RepID=UPI001067BEC6|nr:acetyl-CoA hydrolase/transferase C-terminal domain-containing protein [Lewinella sp. W8]MTB51963.1 4-hydroxybutyrate CoA-transferase [Lewinella sp. W8]